MIASKWIKVGRSNVDNCAAKTRSPPGTDTNVEEWTFRSFSFGNLNNNNPNIISSNGTGNIGWIDNIRDLIRKINTTEYGNASPPYFISIVRVVFINIRAHVA